ncbi:N2227-domain-containing protein [Fistulina hepatica ATCC 64428]|uniref:carnosine N-methyltransferase n=1 Tax=Fistulina hepatica ATCC 64428 TaxID=1128425 RepID=A0A0D7AQT3_9AGAR|nr:N2227-domain-containing protein [Fistulina hepatica ATCC 64428]
MSTSEIEEEKIHFSNVISTFLSYETYSLAVNNRRRKDLYTLPQADQDLLAEIGYKEKLEEVDRAIVSNADFLKKLVADPEIFGHDLSPEGDEDSSLPASQGQVHSHVHDRSRGHGHGHDHGSIHGQEQGHGHGPFHGEGLGHGHDPGRYKSTEFDMDKLRSTLKQFVRDWSTEGQEERETTYAPMKEALLEHFSGISEEDRRKLRVLVPGAGLGRLAYDVAKLGFSCQGNEFSHYMLLASFFILNKNDQIGQHTIYPYVHTFSNVANRAAMLRAISIPDVLPSDLPPNSNFSLVAGDFEEVYGVESEESEPQSGQWDAILTCFFIDTAKNIVNYLRIMHKILTPGGVWINVGPLLWHWENNSTNDPSVELDLEEVKELARKIGFDISNEKTIDTTYTNNSEGMLGYIYHAAFWTATKRT